MNTILKTLRAASLLAAITTFSALGYSADPAKPEDGASPAAQAAPAPQAAKPAAETPLHEIGTPAAAPAAAAVTPAPAPSNGNTERPEHEEQEESFHRNGNGDDNMVAVGGSVDVLANERCEGNAVSVMGPLKVEGTVEGNSVCVMGPSTITGTVRGNVVGVLGGIRLGPTARVDGNVVCVGGTVDRDPSAHIGGNIVTQARGLGIDEDSAAASWLHHGLRLGRPIAFGPHMMVFWALNICLIAFYVLLALAFPNGVTRCADTLAQRPGITFLTGILAMLGLPVLFILLLVTVVGIPVAVVVLPVSVLAATMFGKSAMYAFIGRSVLGRQMPPALAVLVGVAILMVLYIIPFLGLAIWFLVGFLGFASALTTLFTSAKAGQSKAAVPPTAGPTPPVSPAPAVPLPPVMAAAAAPEASVAAAPAAPESALPAAEPPAIAVPPPAAPAPVPVAPALAASAAKVSEASLPRVGFWIRMVALLIDTILIAIVCHRVGDLFLPAMVAYGALLWKFRGATVGDIIFGIKVVKSDGSAIDWTTAIVRALACLLSMVVAGLGFLWIAFDAEKQGWHDKIAGTVVVKLPKASSLV